MINDMNLFLETICIIIIAILVYKLARRGEKNTNFDERMELARGKGCYHAFLTILLLLGIYAVFPNQITRLGFTIPLACVLIICIGVFVFIAYTLWNDAYFAVNENSKKVLRMTLALGAINGIIAYRNVNHFLSMHFFICCTFFAITVVAVVKIIKDKLTEGDEE